MTYRPVPSHDEPDLQGARQRQKDIDIQIFLYDLRGGRLT